MKNNGTIKSYVVGFALSIALTLAGYFLVVHHGVSGGTLIAAILGLALVQLIVQLIFFLHLRKGWNLIFFISTVSIVLIVVIGSLWIMRNLNHNMMNSPAAMNKYLHDQEGGF